MTTIEKWFETRARLNHDVLNNRVLVAFGSQTYGASDVASLMPYVELFVAQERDFRILVTEAHVLLPGSWLADYLGDSLDIAAASALREFLNFDFEKTSSLPGKLREIDDLFERNMTVALRVLHSPVAESDADISHLGTLIQSLSDALSCLPSSMLEVVETMQ